MKPTKYMHNEEFGLRKELAKAKAKIDKLYGQRSLDITLREDINGDKFEHALYDLVKFFYPEELDAEGKAFWEWVDKFNKSKKMHMTADPRIGVWAYNVIKTKFK